MIQDELVKTSNVTCLTYKTFLDRIIERIQNKFLKNESPIPQYFKILTYNLPRPSQWSKILQYLEIRYPFLLIYQDFNDNLSCIFLD